MFQLSGFYYRVYSLKTLTYITISQAQLPNHWVLRHIFWVTGTRPSRSLPSTEVFSLTVPSELHQDLGAQPSNAAQTFQNPLIKEYTLTHIRDPTII